MSTLSESQIVAALDAGIITPEQAEQMRAQNAKTGAAETPATSNQSVIGNEDNMRFVRSFSDVFIAIGIGLLALGLWGLGGMLGGGTSYLLAAGAMALMAAYFGKKKRQHLPTLITALAFLLFTHKGLGGLIGGSGIMVAAITIVAMGAYYAFIRLPFCIALIAISIIFLVFALSEQFAPGLVAGNRSWLFVICGLATFAAALSYDMRDLHRTTRFADNAFWLHFTAAPLIVHGLAFKAAVAKTELMFGLVPVPDVSSGDALFLLIIVGLLGLVGLAINRRALLVSSLGYAAFAIVFLFSSGGVGFGSSLVFALLLVGAAVVFLGAGWHGARNQLIRVLPKWKVFPPAYVENYATK
jgi:hypothetical protein